MSATVEVKSFLQVKLTRRKTDSHLNTETLELCKIPNISFSGQNEAILGSMALQVGRSRECKANILRQISTKDSTFPRCYSK